MRTPAFTRERGPRERGPRECGPRECGPRERGPRERGPRECGPRECGHRCAAQYTRRGSAGFTYIGLLILVAIMGLTMTVVADVWQVTQQRDKEEELLFAGDEIRRAIGLYVVSAAKYPKSLEDLVKDPGFPGVRRYLRKIYRDPMTGRAEWGLLKPDGVLITGVYSLSDAEPLKQGGFRPADQTFAGKKKYSEWVFVSSGAQGAGGTTPADSGTAGPRLRR